MIVHNCELGLGFNGWIGAFHSIARVYGVHLSDEEAKDVILRWRAKHPKLVKLWADLYNAAVKAVITGKEQCVNDKISYDMQGDFLRCKLPSGKYLHYYKPVYAEGTTKWGEKAMTLSYLASKGSGKPFRMDIWPGICIENAAQAIAREILVDAMLRLKSRNYDVRMSTYDEIVAMVPDTKEWTIENFCAIMSETPDWAAGLPIACEGFESIRYKKD